MTGADDASGPTSACFPCGVALGATWNPELVERIGQALAEETQAKGAHILLAPTVNVHRSPLAGRNFECYSEDPFLTGRIGVAYVEGLQGNDPRYLKLAATLKHFAVNNVERDRQRLKVQVSERMLYEYWLPHWRGGNTLFYEVPCAAARTWLSHAERIVVHATAAP